MSGDHNLKADPLVAAAEPIDNKRLTKWLMRTKILRSFTLLSRSEDNKCAECGVTSTDDSMTALYCVDCFSQVIEAAVLAEREACAQVADAFDPEMKWSNYGRVIARSIRERLTQPTSKEPLQVETPECRSKWAEVMCEGCNCWKRTRAVCS